MKRSKPSALWKKHGNTLVVLLLLGAIWLGFSGSGLDQPWQQAGYVNFSLGLLLLMAFVLARILSLFRLPLITGYITAGVLMGPYVLGMLDSEMVIRMRLVDDLALSFIGLAAGAELKGKMLAGRGKDIAVNVAFLTLVIFLLVFSFVLIFGNAFSFISELSSQKIMALAVLLGVFSVARSPSSAIAVISECRAKGRFTETALGVTVAMDVLVIILFTMALGWVQTSLQKAGAPSHMPTASVVLLAILFSLVLGWFVGRGVMAYIKISGKDLALFLLLLALGVSKTSYWMDQYLVSHFNVSLHLEPLLICMSAGFTIGNSKHAPIFHQGLDRFSMPVYLVFFALAGASLNLPALRATWPLALCLVFVRAIGIWVASWSAGTLAGAPKAHNRAAWMAYLTQAGVAIGLAQLAQRQFPEIGKYLTTITLAVIFINQIVGPVLFKWSLERVGETENHKTERT